MPDRTIHLTIFANSIPQAKPLIFLHGQEIKPTVVKEKESYNLQVVIKFNAKAYMPMQKTSSTISMISLYLYSMVSPPFLFSISFLPTKHKKYSIVSLPTILP